MDKQKTVVVPEIYHCDFVMHKEGYDLYSLGIRDGDMLYIQAQKTAVPDDVVAVQVDGVTMLRQVIVFDADSTELQADPVQQALPEKFTSSAREKVQI